MRHVYRQLLITTFFLILLFSFHIGLFPETTTRKLIKVFNSFENYVNYRSFHEYDSQEKYEADVPIKENDNLIKIFQNVSIDGRVLSADFFIPKAYRPQYDRHNLYGFKEASTTRKMIAVFDSLETLFKKNPIKIYKSNSCDSDYYNDTIGIFKNRSNLIKVVYYCNEKSNYLYQAEHQIPHDLLDTYFQKIISFVFITKTQAEQAKQKAGAHLLLKFNCRAQYIDERMALELEKVFGKQVIASNTPVSAEPSQVKRYYFHTDAIGSVVAVTDESGKLVERVEYTPQGDPTFWAYTQDPNNPVKRSRSVIDNDILFQGRKYDYDTGLYNYRNRYYDPIMGRFLQTDPLGYQNSMNPYQAFNNNPVNFTDPLGLEPVKIYAGVVADIVFQMNNTKSKIGLTRGREAEKTLRYLGLIEVKFKQGIPKPEPAKTAPFNTKKGRYIYTQKGGWIDMAHFLFYAGRAYTYKSIKEDAQNLRKNNLHSFMSRGSQKQTAMDSNLNPSGEAMQDGFIQEKMDSLFAPHSAYSYEDLPSDKLGIIFALKYFDPTSNLTLSEQVANFLNNILGATVPTAAHNWNNMPKDDTRNPPSRTNKTTTPMYTSEEEEECRLFFQWMKRFYQ